VGEGQKSGVYWALDRATMEPVWRTTVGPGGYLGGLLGSTAFDGERIFAADTVDGQVSALGRDGLIAWQSADTAGAHLSPVSVAHGVVYSVDPSGTLVARDPASGTVLARLSLGGASFGGVSADGGAVYVSVGTGPLPEPAPQNDSPGSIVAFGDTSRSGGHGTPRPGPPPLRRGRRIRLTVAPRRVRALQVTPVRFRARVGSEPLARVTIRVAGRVVRTNRRGRARLRMRVHRPGRYVLRANRRGFRGARTHIRVVAR
jgi:hypothetical protein